MEFKYKAFISYRHVERDSAAAKAIHTAVERYVIPKKLRKDGKKHPGRVFRDEEELSISEDLSEDICEALDQSEFLIVVCSPDTLDSKWVPREIAYFREHRDPENILTVLTGGDPGEIFRTLMPGMPEPLFLDLSGSPTRAIARELKEQFLKLCAPLLGCRYDDLVRRDEKRRRRQMMWWSAGIAAVASVIIGILMWSNWQIEGKNEELERQNNEILLRESELLTQEALEALEAGDQVAAVRNALSALPSAESDRPYYAPAEQALFSALDILSINDASMIPKDTYLTQSTPIKDFCINTDGSRLFTLDEYKLLTCFDTATGDQLWTRELTTNSILDGLLSTNSRIYPCKPWNSIIATCGNTIYSTDQLTGEIMWINELAYYNEFYELSDDGQYLACQVNTSYPDHTLSVAIVSTSDGSTLNVFPVAESESSLVLPNTDAYDFSADGTRFAGCYAEQLSDGSNVLVYFVTDLTTGRTETILRQNSSDIYGNIYELSFSAGDSTLTIVRDPGDSNSAAIVEKVSIPDKALIWQTATPSEEDGWKYFGVWHTYHLIECDSFLLLGAYNSLYALDPADGTLLASRRLDTSLVNLEPRNDGYYALTLDDGTHSFGWLSSHGLYYTSDIYAAKSPRMELGAVQDIKLWNEGYMRVFWGDEGTTVSFGSEEDGAGYAALIPKDDDRTVIIRRLGVFRVDLDRRTLLTGEPDEEMIYAGIHAYGDNSLLVSCVTDNNDDTESTRFVLFDRNTLEITDSIVIELENYSIYSSPFLKDAKGFLYTNDDLQICAYDFETQTSTVLGPQYGSTLLSSNGHTYDTKCWDLCHIRSAADYSLWSILLTSHGMKLWIDAEAQPDILYPKSLSQIGEYGLYGTDVLLGADGYILLDLMGRMSMLEQWGESVDPLEYDIDSYLFYSVHDAKWYEIPFGEQDATHHRTCMCETSPTFTVMGDDGLIRSYDIPTGKQTMEVATGLNTNTVSQLKWIMEDRYLTIFTEDQQLLIIDGDLAQTVYHVKLSDYFFSDSPSFAADPSEKRLYIWDSNNGLCVSIEDWATLFEIPDIGMYDPVSDRILYIDQYWGEDYDTDKVHSYRIPATEELIDLGLQYLGE